MTGQPMLQPSGDESASRRLSELASVLTTTSCGSRSPLPEPPHAQPNNSNQGMFHITGVQEYTVVMAVALCASCNRRVPRKQATEGLVLGCDEGDKKTEATNDAKKGVSLDTTGTVDLLEDVALPICPGKVILTGLLPCNCYGMVATDPDAQIPGCITQVVCCPTVHGLRCEDHELLEPKPEFVEDVAPETVAEVVDPVDATTMETCPNEVDLADYTPCTCQGTLVEDVLEAMPDCTKKVVCCPFDGLKCE